MFRSSMDIGSNTVRVLVAEGRGADMRRLAVKRRITRLSGNFKGELDPDSMTRTLAAVREFSEFAGSMGAGDIRTGCTGVIRKARNRAVFLNEIRESAGIEPVLLDGGEEARLAALGARHHLGAGFPDILLVDIGGFSTELAVAGKTIGRRESCELGVVSLTEGLLTSDPPSTEQVAELRRQVSDRIGDFFKQPVPGILVGISGTPSTIAAIDLKMEVFDAAKIHRHVVSEAALGGMLDRLLKMKKAERLPSVKGLEKGREDLIPAGIVILQEIMKAGNFGSFMISTGSLLDGILLAETWPPATAMAI